MLSSVFYGSTLIGIRWNRPDVNNAVLDVNRMTAQWFRRREGTGHTSGQVETCAMRPAFDGPAFDEALGERYFRVRAGVINSVDRA